MRRRDPVLQPLMADLEVGLAFATDAAPTTSAAEPAYSYIEAAKPLTGHVRSTHDTSIYWEVHGLAEGERCGEERAAVCDARAGGRSTSPHNARRSRLNVLEEVHLTN